MTTPAAKPYCHGDPKQAKVMVIGHDPRLQRSDTVAPYCLFADYFFRPKPTKGSEAAKYGLAASTFRMVSDLTGGMADPEEVLVTNLCNCALPHAPQGKTVLIPQNEAQRGIDEIRRLLDGSSVRAVLAMSQQVNWWLQRLGFCAVNEGFLSAAEPRASGLRHDPPFYQSKRPRAFTLVCGDRNEGPGGVPVFPVVHVKNWPLKGRFREAYGDAHERCARFVQTEMGKATGVDPRKRTQ